jgi:fibronectin type 3 domain-containing protein
MAVCFARRISRGVVRVGVPAALLAVTALLVGLPAPRADSTRIHHVRAEREATVAPTFTNVRELIRRTGAIHYPKHPPRWQIPLGQPDDGPQRPSIPALFSAVSRPPRSLAPAPNVVKSFDTFPDPGDLEPPDNGLAVGNDHLIAAGNVSWGIWKKSDGARLFLIPFTDWYQGLDNTGFIFDPRVDFDERTGRYYLWTVSVDFNTEQAFVDLSVSMSSDPLGTWAKYVFNVKENNPSSWLDFPSVGHNDTALFITGNVFGFDFSWQHTTLRALDKAKLLAGQAVTPNRIADLGGQGDAFTVQPVVNHDSTTDEWMVETDRFGQSFVRLWKMTDPLSATPTITSKSFTVPGWSFPPPQSQKDNDILLAGGDGRTGSGVMRNGEVWCTHGVGSGGRGTVRVYRFGTSGAGTLDASFEISDPSLSLHYPSLDVASSGFVLVGYSSSAPSIFPSISFSTLAPGSDTFSDPGFMVEGRDSYTPKSFGNRWGDYSDTAIDPVDPELIWHQNELSAGGSLFKLTAGAIKLIVEPRPAAPTSLAAVAKSPSQIDLSWIDNADNERGFKLERKKGTGTFAPIAGLAPDVTTYSDKSLESNVSYTYRVRAFNFGGNSDYSNEAEAKTPRPIPGPPSEMFVSARSQTEIDVSWSDNSPVEDGYRLERSRSGGAFEPIAELPANTQEYADSGLTANTAYTYRVKAFNSSGESAYSNVATDRTLPNPPPVPGGLTATAVSPSQIDLQWTDAGDAEDGFKIERKKPDGTFGEIGSVDGDTLTFSNLSLKASTEYTYRVKAFNRGGSSGYTPERSATTPTNLPAAPTELAAKVVSQTQIDLTWKDNSTIESGFQLQRSKDNGATFTTVVTTAANTTAYSDRALTAATAYLYKVRAVNADGGSDFTATVTATTLPNPPAAPTDLKAAALSSTQIQLRWTHSGAGVETFRLERKRLPAEPFVQVATPSAAARDYTDEGLAPNTSYTYRLSASNAGGTSATTAEASATTQPVIGGVLSVTPAKVNFGSVKVRKKKLVIVTIRNTSSQEQMKVTVAKPKAPFSLQQAVPATTLAPGGEITARVLFSPKTRGKAKGKLTITSTDPGHLKLVVPLTGVGK